MHRDGLLRYDAQGRTVVAEHTIGKEKLKRKETGWALLYFSPTALIKGLMYLYIFPPIKFKQSFRAMHRDKRVSRNSRAMHRDRRLFRVAKRRDRGKYVFK